MKHAGSPGAAVCAASAGKAMDTPPPTPAHPASHPGTALQRGLLGLLGLLGHLPLPLLHTLGGWLGWLTFRLSPRMRRLTRENLRGSGLCPDEAVFARVLREAVREQGRQALELPFLWFRPAREVCALVRGCDGQDAVLEAIAAGRGVVLLTPHLGCFEVAAIYAASLFPLTALYRAAKLPLLNHLMVEGRRREGLALAPADRRGVRMIYQALRRGEAVGILPDQAPGAGDGVWAPFFGRPAYTMTMVGRLCEALDPAVFLAFARRLPAGAGYHIVVRRVTGELRGEAGARTLNAALEQLIAEAPGQYLWGYNRYKEPAGARRRPDGS